MLADTEPLQAKLFSEMKDRIKEDDAGVPQPDGAFAYYRRYVEDGQHPLFCRIPRDGGDERILIDGNALAAPHAYFHIAVDEDSLRSEEHTSELQSLRHLVCRLLLEKKKNKI